MPKQILSPDDRALLVRYYSGACTAADADRVRELEDPSTPLGAHARMLADAMATSQPAWSHTDVDRAIARWTERDRLVTTVRVTPKPDLARGWFIPRTRRWTGWVGGAAAVAIGVIAIVAVKRQQTTAPLASQAYHTGVGEIASVRLSDGTVMTLAPASSATVSKRIVTLVGQASFDVPTQARDPFLVKTGSAEVRVLGTAFDVRQYGTERGARVTVSSGKVSVLGTTGHGPHTPAVLSAQMMATTTDSGVVTNQVGHDNDASWMRGRLMFDNAPASDLFESLGRWYGYRFRVTDSTLTSRRVTVALSTRSSAAALATLELILNVDVTVQGDIVTLTPRSTPRRPAPRRDRQNVVVPTAEVGR